MIKSGWHIAKYGVVLVLMVFGSIRVAADPAPTKPAELYEQDKVWTIHLTFTAEQWQAMEPTRGRGQFGVPRAAAPKFDLGNAIAPNFLVQGDTNGDGSLSAKEFVALGEKWFAGWDKQKSGTLTLAQLREGINLDFAGTRGPGVRPNPIGISLQGQPGKRNGLSAAFGTEFPTVHADLQIDDTLLKDVAVRYKGNGTFMESRASLKRSFKIDVGKFVQGQKLAGVATLNLHNCVTDSSLMNEVLAHRLFRDAGIPAPRTSYARVYVTVPGKHDRQYFGLYSMVENVDAIFAVEHFGKKGAMFKPVTPDIFSDLGDEWKNYIQTYDPKYSPTVDDAQRLINFCKFITYADHQQFAARLADFVDLDELARFLAVTVYISDLDGILGPGQNLYLYLHPKTHKLLFIPWDHDHSFGQFAMVGNQLQREQLSIAHPWRIDNRFLIRLFNADAFKALYRAKMEQYSTTLFKPQRFHDQVDEIAKAIREAVTDEGKTKSVPFEKAVSGEAIPTGAFSFLSGEAMKPIRSFVDVRTKSIIDQLAGKSQGQVIAGRLIRMTLPADLFAPGIAMDADKDGQISHDEFMTAFKKWFEMWDANGDGALSAEELRAGLNKSFAP